MGFMNDGLCCLMRLWCANLGTAGVTTSAAHITILAQVHTHRMFFGQTGRFFVTLAIWDAMAVLVGRVPFYYAARLASYPRLE